MATQTRRLQDFGDPRWGTCHYDFDYSDVPNADGTMTVLALRCVNASSRAARCWLAAGGRRFPASGWVYTPPNTTDVQNLPGQQATRLGVRAVDAGGGRIVLDGLDGEFQWPVDAPG
jgi:hypothetical protein